MVRSRNRQQGAVSAQRSLGQWRGVERVTSWPRRQPRQARSAQRQVLCGQSAGSPRDEARARRAPRDEKETATTIRSRSRQQGAVSAQRSLGQWRGVERAASWPRRQPRQEHAARSDKCSVGGRLVLHVTKRARAARPGLEREGYVGSKPQPPTWRGVCARCLGQWRGVERVASWPRRQPRQVRSAQCVLRGWSAGSPRDEARARVARHGTRKRRLRRC